MSDPNQIQYQIDLIDAISADLKARFPIWMELSNKIYCPDCEGSHPRPLDVYGALLMYIVRNILDLKDHPTEDEFLQFCRHAYREIGAQLVSTKSKQ